MYINEHLIDKCTRTLLADVLADLRKRDLLFEGLSFLLLRFSRGDQAPQEYNGTLVEVWRERQLIQVTGTLKRWTPF